MREIRVVDFAGQVVIQVEVNGYREEIIITGMNSGVYPPQQDMGECLVLLPGLLWYQDDQFFIGSVEYRVEISN